MSRYRKKPVEIEARQVGDGSYKALAKWCGGEIIRGYRSTVIGLIIPTLEGKMRADVGDWVIQGVQGEFYPCKPQIFYATYELVTP